MEATKECWKETARKAGITLTEFKTFSDALPSKRKLEELFPKFKFTVDRLMILDDWSISKIS